MEKKQRTEIPIETADEILFLSDRTCCICRLPKKGLQLHHLDENPANSEKENLAALCFECHNDTMLKGGFDRKLTAGQILLYRTDWYNIVDRRRHGPGREAEAGPPQSETWVAGLKPIELHGSSVRLKYLQTSNADDKNRYSFSAEYPEISPATDASASEINLSIAAFINNEHQGFRNTATETAEYKKAALLANPKAIASTWDDRSISFEIVSFHPDLLSIDFTIFNYSAGAAHPHHLSRPMNFFLSPYVRSIVRIEDLFKPQSSYLEFLSEFCVRALLSNRDEAFSRDWVLRGAGPQVGNFQKFLVSKSGLQIVFDEYQVDCYAAGRQEVHIPASRLREYASEPLRRVYHF
jgi:hypothetical protein